MVNVIPKFVENLWNIWNIRVAILFSLFLQAVLILLAPNRKNSLRKMLALILWSAYLLVDATATYAVGLIFANQCKDIFKNDHDLLAFWSPFLLVHLGGPNTITALALEDNELWLRHFLTLVFQAAAILYVFLKSLPENKLMIPMILMFISRCIKYLERTRSLYLASSGRSLGAFLSFDKFVRFRYFEHLLMRDNRPVDDLEVVKGAYRLFKDFKCRFVDLIASSYQRNQSRLLFGSITATSALRLIEVELNFAYEVLFTKTIFVHSSMVSYALFLGAVTLELIAFLMVVLSDWTVVTMIESEESEEYPDQRWWRKIVVQPALCKIWSYWTLSWYLEEYAQPKDKELRRPLLFRRWSGCLSGHNLIRYCLKGQPSSGIPIVKAMYWVIDGVGLGDLLDEMTCLSRQPLRKNLWSLIFQQLKDKSHFVQQKPKDDREIASQQIASAKGEWVLQGSDVVQNFRNNLKECIDAPYDESLLLWHVATELLYNVDHVDPTSKNNAEMSKTLSDYMLYLLIKQPNIMAAFAAIGKTRFQDTCTEVKKLFDEKNLGPSQQVEACNYLLEEYDNARYIMEKNKSSSVLLKPRSVVLLKASKLAKELQELGGRKWEFISQVWVELLCHAAYNSRGKAHAQQLSKGGELITFVWLLMSHFGIGYHY